MSAAVVEQFDPDVNRFTARHRIRPHLRRAVALARECFPWMVGIRAEVVSDPECGDEWIDLVVRLRADADSEEVFAAYNRYTIRWIETVRWPAVSRVVLSPETEESMYGH